ALISAPGMIRAIRTGRAAPATSAGSAATAAEQVAVGVDLSTASGTVVYRHIPAGSTNRLPLGLQGIAEPKGWPLVNEGSVAARAFNHDLGMTECSGFTSWTASKSWAFARQARMGGIVIEATAPEGSIWFNAAAKGAEYQVLVPGRVQGQVIVGGGS
ncbi:MAG: hypothetical protein KDB27_05185, partial [Planctomycetales bacterium]|nr:hypothetical protein [Planctomycetales bacterium]